MLRVVSMQSSAQEVTMLFKLIAAAKDSWVCLQAFHKKKNKNLWSDLHVFLHPFFALYSEL